MRGYNGYSDDHYDDRSDEMCTAASHCSRFSRRRDVDSFNMIDYQSCENCSHMTADDQCIMKMNQRIMRTE